jgi:predicted nucleic acid-binding protein
VIGYVDTSVLLRLALNEAAALPGLEAFDTLVSSELIAVESARTIDRLRLQGALSLADAAERLRRVTSWLDAVELVFVRPAILRRASEPLPVPLGTLDAMHLATALAWRERTGGLDVVLTHDVALGVAARAFGFDVRGA